MAEMFPGAISIKSATYAGYKVAGIPGAVVANLAPAKAGTAACILYGSCIVGLHKIQEQPIHNGQPR